MNQRVLLISPQPYFQWRGSPIRVGFDALALSESGYPVDLLVMPVGEEREIPGVTLHRCANPLHASNLPIGPSPMKAFLDIFLLLKALKLARKNRYAVIHGIEDAGIIALLAARLYGGRTVFEKHSDPSSYKKKGLRSLVMWAYSRVESFCIRHADAVIGTGPGLVDQARRLRPDVNAHHIFDIPSSLAVANATETAAVRARLQTSPDEKLVLYVGSFAVYQGIDLMFEAMPLVVERDANARFVVIGGTTAEIAERMTWLRERGIEDAVTFVGKVPPDELPNYLVAADVLLSPRIAGNNTPLKLLDYLKAGRAILATDNVANRLILDESCSALAAPEAAPFAEALGDLLADGDRREQLAAAGRRLVQETYNFPEFKRRLAACYESLDGPG